MHYTANIKKELTQYPRCMLRLFPAVVCLLAIVVFVTPVYAQKEGLESLRNTSKAFAAVAREASPAVVYIQIEQSVKSQPTERFFFPFGGGPFGNDFFRRFFGEPLPEQPKQFRKAPQQHIVGQGSGFIISTDGYILTNNHVVGNADKITVRLNDGRVFTAKTIGTDKLSDVAVIKIEATDLPVLPLGDSDSIEVGEWVIAIGNPFGLSHTLTVGVVSAKGRSGVGLADYEDFIQTDAAINPGNSGGPLVDLEGKAIGMNTAIFSRSGGNMGIGFAIPINMVKSIKDQLVKSGSVTRGYLGIMIQDLTPELKKSFGLKDQKGILISQVTEGSPAEKAGLKQGDVIIEFDGKPTEKIVPFRNHISLISPGTKKEITVLREGKRKNLTIAIGKLTNDKLIAGGFPSQMGDLGITVQTLTPDLARQFDVKGEKGVIVTQVAPGSIAEMAGIEVGAIIEEVNRKQVRNIEEFKHALARTPEDGTVLLLVKGRNYSRYITLKLK
ncbi:MAG: DegQ family serine endoprotease [Candidatus Scalinduaceae bacterium]